MPPTADRPAPQKNMRHRAWGYPVALGCVENIFMVVWGERNRCQHRADASPQPNFVVSFIVSFVDKVHDKAYDEVATQMHRVLRQNNLTDCVFSLNTY